MIYPDPELSFGIVLHDPYRAFAQAKRSGLHASAISASESPDRESRALVFARFVRVVLSTCEWTNPGGFTEERSPQIWFHPLAPMGEIPAETTRFNLYMRTEVHSAETVIQGMFQRHFETYDL